MKVGYELNRLQNNDRRCSGASEPDADAAMVVG